MASCNKVSEYNRVPFVTLNTASATVNEADPATTWFLPVIVNNHPKACTVTYTVEAISAKAGVDYTVLDAAGVLEFVGNESKNIAISVSGQVGTYTGDLKFRVKLVSATDGVELGDISTCTVTVKDLDHPLSALFGEYTMRGVTYDSDQGSYVYPSWTLTISPVEGSTTKVQLKELVPFGIYYKTYIGDLYLTGTVSADKKTITVASLQKTGNATAFGYDGDQFTFYLHGGAGGEYITDPGKVTFTLDNSGRWVTADSFGVSHPDDLPDYPSMFYEYTVVYSNLSASYPTYFVKN